MWWIQLYIQASIFMSYCEMKCGSFSHLQEQENVAVVDLAQTQSNHYSLHCCCCYCCQVTSVVSDSVRSHRWQPTRLPSLGSSRQEHWSGLPFPSPVQESEKWKWSRSVVSDSVRPHGLQPTRLLRSMGFPRQEYWSGSPLPSLWEATYSECKLFGRGMLFLF